ncbi:hypothetical protein MXB_2483 [Myxobolus squamalis]|nr:hypothetical protein MXB_2483 [Myxobolus squamalis]
MKLNITPMNLISKALWDLSAAERQEMLTKLLREHENAILLPAPIYAGRKRRRMEKDEEVKIALKLWLESMQLRGSRISRAVLKEKVEDFGRQLRRDFKTSDS